MKTFVLSLVSIFRIRRGDFSEVVACRIFFVIFSKAQEDRKLTPSMKWSTAMIRECHIIDKCQCKKKVGDFLLV